MGVYTSLYENHNAARKARVAENHGLFEFCRINPPQFKGEYDPDGAELYGLKS